jgi:hypothetical protein
MAEAILRHIGRQDCGDAAQEAGFEQCGEASFRAPLEIPWPG